MPDIAQEAMEVRGECSLCQMVRTGCAGQTGAFLEALVGTDQLCSCFRDVSLLVFC